MEKSFYYSQNSLGTFQRCPKMFEYIYIDGISGRGVDPELKKSIERGTDFHILAERYFNGMKDYFYIRDEQLLEWMDVLEKRYPEKVDCKSEVEIRQDKDEIRLMAKYDLLIIEDDKIKIVDFKTNKNPYNVGVMEESIQTKVYMFLLGENFKKIFPKKKINDISMEYFQLNYPGNKIFIEYNEKKHEKNKKILKELIGEIKKNKKNFFIKNNETCEKCGFESFCKKN
ncbi:PD-(D/E)XK nuclease family protein [Psychrilyobacter atlanticus]|uniref:PD-(D/E)XK nuclease family protein n=1 Tax=Psychrilyobacter atlanticus TaxID=271091 RepID=UPI000403FB1A|nr:PD-(D/E)XK nuclease family protein [Psychrilyobacter atlanticus]